MKRRTEITIERHEIKTIRVRGGTETFCSMCNGRTTSLTRDQVSQSLAFSPEELAREISERRIHLTNDEAHPELICGNSLEAKQT